MSVYEFTKETRESRENIYHYTSVDALMKIIENKKLRFTECRFLNDKNEFKGLSEILDKIKTNLNELMQENWEEINQLADEEYENNFKMVNKSGSILFKKNKYYILSFSTEKDSLPLWNYYTKNMNSWGYSIHIVKNEIINKFKEIDNNDISLYYGKVLYKEKEKREFLEEKIKTISDKFSKKIIEKNRNSNSSINSYFDFEESVNVELRTELYNLFQLCRLFFKDSYFSYEKEYRFVISCIDDESIFSSMREFSSINGIIRPHLELDLKKLDFLSGITVSPLIEYDLAVKGLEYFLNSKECNISKDKILKSKINIRF